MEIIPNALLAVARILMSSTCHVITSVPFGSKSGRPNEFDRLSTRSDRAYPLTELHSPPPLSLHRRIWRRPAKSWRRAADAGRRGGDGPFVAGFEDGRRNHGVAWRRRARRKISHPVATARPGGSIPALGLPTPATWRRRRRPAPRHPPRRRLFRARRPGAPTTAAYSPSSVSMGRRLFFVSSVYIGRGGPRPLRGRPEATTPSCAMAPSTSSDGSRLESSSASAGGRRFCDGGG